MDDEVVRAAGGVVWRATPTRTEVLLIHRPKYDDWSLPKGKADPGEDDLSCALREVREETGLACEPTEPLGTSEYTTRKGRPKVVRFWAMRALGGQFVPNSEVDEVRWIALAEVAAHLTYDREKEVVAGLGDPAAGSEPAPEVPG